MRTVAGILANRPGLAKHAREMLAAESAYASAVSTRARILALAPLREPLELDVANAAPATRERAIARLREIEDRERALVVEWYSRMWSLRNSAELLAEVEREAQRILAEA